MTDEPEAKRARLSRHELESMSKDDLMRYVCKQHQHVDNLVAQLDEQRDSSELVSLRESEEKLKQQQLEATRRENVLVMRLTAKEQEMQDYANQIQELKQAQVPGVSQLRSALLDPAVNLLFERMKKELESTKAKLEETQNDLSAWKFTPDSNTGKRLMAKCRLLYQENEELGKMISSGRVAKLESDLALQRNFSEEMKKSQEELDCFVMELDSDMEGLQSTIYYLQQQLREAKDANARLQQEAQKLAKLVPFNGETTACIVISEHQIQVAPPSEESGSLSTQTLPDAEVHYNNETNEESSNSVEERTDTILTCNSNSSAVEIVPEEDDGTISPSHSFRTSDTGKSDGEAIEIANAVSPTVEVVLSAGCQEEPEGDNSQLESPMNGVACGDDQVDEIWRNSEGNEVEVTTSEMAAKNLKLSQDPDASHAESMGADQEVLNGIVEPVSNVFEGEL